MFICFCNPFTSPPPITTRVEPRPMHVTLKINFDDHRQLRPLNVVDTLNLHITDLFMHLNSL